MNIDIKERVKAVGLHQTLDEIEKHFVEAALQDGRSREASGASIGVRRTTYLMMLKKHGLFVARPCAIPRRLRGLKVGME